MSAGHCPAFLASALALAFALASSLALPPFGLFISDLELGLGLNSFFSDFGGMMIIITGR
jgi:hypothetical protein